MSVALFFSLSLVLVAGCNKRVFTLEKDFAPLIVALERYRSDSGAFRENLEQLTPRYVSSIPSCPAEHRPEVSYHLRKDGKFIIQCEVGTILLFPQFAIYESDGSGWIYGG